MEYNSIGNKVKSLIRKERREYDTEIQGKIRSKSSLESKCSGSIYQQCER